MILLSYTDNQGILLGSVESLGTSPGGAWFSSWYVVSIHTGHIAQSPQSGPRCSPALKREPVLFPPSVLQRAYAEAQGLVEVDHCTILPHIAMILMWNC